LLVHTQGHYTDTSCANRQNTPRQSWPYLLLSPALHRGILTTTNLPTSEWCSSVDLVISPRYVCNNAPLVRRHRY